ncbi:MAG: D-alanyl-D-alanine carboxypeptidase [Actinomycetia bacterium]|nr:D-alanyl-D-alanine carboxypeptidase [Actinomycetes bacterium]
MPRITRKRRARRLAGVGLAAGALALTSCASEANSEQDLPPAAAEIIQSDPYQSGAWSYLIKPGDSESPAYSSNPDALVPMGSNAKLYSVGTWVESTGPDTQITTPVHQVGDGLSLVAMGDLVMGGRQADTGTLGYSIPPQPDANGLPGAKPAPGNPLAGLNDLAKQVVEAGVTSVSDVEIDVRLFDQWEAHGEVISPIVINDNLMAIQSKPGQLGDAATLTVIPKTQAFKIENRVETVASGADSSIAIVAEDDDRTLRVEGTIAADSDPLLNVYEVPDPASFARTLFIEALERQSVSVDASPTATNDMSGLPKSYPADSQVAAITSPTVSAIATLIWKISHNYGANLTACLLAVASGSKDCEAGLQTIHDQITEVGIAPDSVWLLDGAGESFSSNTPAAVVAWISWLRGLEWGDQLAQMLPILGVDGSLKLFQTDTPATGKVQGKTGTYAGLEPGSNKLLVPAQALAGLMQGTDGQEYVFGLYAANGTFGDPATDILKSAQNVADVAAAFQEALSGGE